MRRFTALIAIAVMLAFVPASAAVAAGMTQSDANHMAQTYQDSQCGRGWDWVCSQKQWPAANCHWNTEYATHFWDCYGAVEQQHLSPDLKWRVCDVWQHIRAWNRFYSNNTCF